MAYTVVDNPTEYFNTVLYTGNGVDDRDITGLDFQPDMLWSKIRSGSDNHSIYDVVRGATKELRPQSVGAELIRTNNIQALNSDGFQVGTDSQVNASGSTYVSWGWSAGGAGVSNTAGTISSTVSANTTSGFSVVGYTGNSTAGATIGHGLGATPAMIICKDRSGAEEWSVYHQSLTFTKYLVLETTAAAVTNSRFYQAPTSSLFYVSDSYGVNKNNDNYIAYCFAEVKGYSKFGSYTGNGSTDGPFIYTGFKPAFVLQKNTTAVQGWQLQDNKRLGYNPDNYLLQPHTDQSESAVQRIDILSNGFKVRTTDAGQNSSGAVYIYMCFAESPFTTSTEIPTTAR